MNASARESAPAPESDEVMFRLIADTAFERLGENRRVYRALPGGGRLVVDRRLPFLCVYRTETDNPDLAAQALLTSEASYLIAPADPRLHASVTALCQRVETAMQGHFGRFLRIELWPATDAAVADPASVAAPPLKPGFTVICHPNARSGASDKLVEALSAIQVAGIASSVTLATGEEIGPPGLEPIKCAHSEPECTVLGLAVRPIYRDRDTASVYPILLRTLRAQLARALRKTVAHFAAGTTTEAAPHFHSYGPRTLVRSVRRVDKQLCDVAKSFDFILQASPTNIDDAWGDFKQGGYKTEPVFAYRPLPYDPIALKRSLFEVPTDAIADATLSHLFREKQVELDRQISALRDLHTPSFRYACFQLYGGADDALVGLAQALLAQVKAQASLPRNSPRISVAEAARLAREEINYYRGLLPDFAADVRTDVVLPAGIMVSGSVLMISSNARLTADRIAPLLHHEVGVHLLTYFNGRQQAVRQLSVGLAGYEGLQEGMAVLVEHLAGGLTPRRLRTLAGRVVAVRMMADGAPFVTTFHSLHQQYGLPARTAFLMTVRVYRGGGISKDAIYLRGLRDLLEFLAAGGDIEPLFCGKAALCHVNYLTELRRRGIVQPPALMPRLWGDLDAQRRLRECRGRTVLELLETTP